MKSTAPIKKTTMMSDLCLRKHLMMILQQQITFAYTHGNMNFNL